MLKEIPLACESSMWERESKVSFQLSLPFRVLFMNPPFCHASLRTLRESARVDPWVWVKNKEKRWGTSPTMYRSKQLACKPQQRTALDPLGPGPPESTPYQLAYLSSPAWAHTESLSGLTGGSLFSTKPVYKEWKRWLLFQMYRYQYKVQGLWRQGNKYHQRNKIKLQ